MHRLPWLVPCFRMLSLAACLGGSAAAVPPPSSMNSDLVPVPASLEQRSGALALSSSFYAVIERADDPRVPAALTRLLEAWEARTGLHFRRSAEGPFAFKAGGQGPSLLLRCEHDDAPVPRLGDDESYTLEVGERGVELKAPGSTGLLRGLASLGQLLRVEKGAWILPAVSIKDRPRFPWRGLMIDVARHFMPVEVLKRQMDGMALVKFNVLHLHLCDDQGFRLESRRFPRLHGMGSDGLFYTQEQLRDIIAYAAARGIRVVPELDVPGHATSWLVGHPELGCEPGPAVIERKWGIFRATLDPTKEEVYTVLSGLLGEVAALFPDDFIHIGGDEVEGSQWTANPRIQAFIRTKGLEDNKGLQAHFNKRLADIIASLGKKMMGWNEILHPDLPKTAVVHVWSDRTLLATAAKAGHPVVFSRGYYLDLMHPSWMHYAVDPSPGEVSLGADENSRILGGEATMWNEWVSPETIDGRIWPRAAAIAERYWSPASVTDPADMVRRLAIVSRRLEEAGLRHERNRGSLIRMLAGEGAKAGDLRRLDRALDLLEPVKDYERGRHFPEADQFSPLTGLVDATRPESVTAWHFAEAVARLVLKQGGGDPALRESIRATLESWRSSCTELKQLLAHYSPRVAEGLPLWSALENACDAGLAALKVLESGKGLTAEQAALLGKTLDQASRPFLGLQIPFIPALRTLVECSARRDERKD